MTSQNSNDAPALLTCVMCGGENALDTTQCQSCGAALQLSSAASTRAPLKSGGASETNVFEEAAARITSVDANSPVVPSGNHAAKNAALSDTPRDDKPTPATTTSEAANRAAPPTAMPQSIVSPRGAEKSESAPVAATAKTASASAPPKLAANAKTTAETPASRAAIPSDARQVQALLDRAFVLAEGGHLDAAILTSSEAAAMQPQSAAAHSMLGLLLERAGDPEGAKKAYERTLRIEPENRLAQGSIARLQQSISREPNASIDETKAVAAPLAPNASRQNVSETSIAARRSNNETAPEETIFSFSTTFENANSPVDAAATSGTRSADTLFENAAGSTPPVARAATSAPSATSNTASTRSNADNLARVVQADVSALAGLAPGFVAEEDQAARDANALRKNSSSLSSQKMRGSYFVRSMPLAATTFLGACFLVWASARAPQNAASTRAMVVATPAPTATPAVAATPTSAPESVRELSVQEQLAGAVAAARAGTPVPTATPIVLNPAGSSATASATPAPAAPSVTPPVGAQNSVSTSPAMPSPILATPVAPAFPDASRAPQVTPQAAPTPTGDSSNFERAAQLQARALSALEGGDNAAASRGFSEAISAYSAQIATGFRADEARAAIEACREGIRLAQQLRR